MVELSVWAQWFQEVAWVGAAVGGLGAAAGGLAAAFRALREVRENRVQRERELRWKQAMAASDLVDKMLSDPEAGDALLMLDYSGREFADGDGNRFVITWEKLHSALRTTDTTFSNEDIYVRDRFDKLLFYMGRCENHIQSKIFVFEDTRLPLEYYIGRMAAHAAVFKRYMGVYDFDSALNFVRRFEVWTRAEGPQSAGG